MNKKNIILILCLLLFSCALKAGSNFWQPPMRLPINGSVRQDSAKKVTVQLGYFVDRHSFGCPVEADELYMYPNPLGGGWLLKFNQELANEFGCFKFRGQRPLYGLCQALREVFCPCGLLGDCSWSAS